MTRAIKWKPLEFAYLKEPDLFLRPIVPVISLADNANKNSVSRLISALTAPL